MHTQRPFRHKYILKGYFISKLEAVLFVFGKICGSYFL
jgi:hypothetical protein